MSGLLYRSQLVSLGQKIFPTFTTIVNHRQFSKTNTRLLKEIVKTVSADGKIITFEGVNVKSPREDKLINPIQLQSINPAETTANSVPNSESKKCILCRLQLDIKHTDVLILQQFLDPNGIQLQRKVTGLCMPQHRRMDYFIQMAKLAGILKTPADPEPTKRHGFLKYNKYYDESVIDEFLTSNRRKA